jgi:integrase
MRVFKATYKDRHGRPRESSKWYVEFTDHLAIVRRLPVFTDRKQTEELGRKVERLVCGVANREAPDLMLARWLETLPVKMRDVLARWGLIDAKATAAGKPLFDHLSDFRTALVAKGNTAKHAEQTYSRLKSLFDGCGFKHWSDVKAASVESHLATMRESSDDQDARGKQTTNYYLGAAKQFCRWMVRNGRATQNPLEHLRKLNAASDNRRERRALSADELRLLLAATATEPERFGLTGAERGLVYWLAVETGLRAAELRSLTRLSFRFGTKLATVTVEAGSSKRRRRDELPLRTELAAALQSHLSAKLPTALAFHLPPSYDTAAMLREDLAAARQAWLKVAPTPADRAERERSTFLTDVDEAGRVVDFHALRHSFITALARSGVHPKVAQQLARHSTITLTMDRYSHVETGEMSVAVANLPDLSAAARVPQQATGTDGRQAADPCLADCLADSDAESCASLPFGAEQVGAEGSAAIAENDLKNAGEPAIPSVVYEAPRQGLEPWTSGLTVACLSGERQA